MVGAKVKGMQTLDKSTLMKRLGPMLTNKEGGRRAEPQGDPAGLLAGATGLARDPPGITGIGPTQGIRKDDYMGDPVAGEVLKFYEERDAYLQEPKEECTDENLLASRTSRQRSLEDCTAEKYRLP